MSRWFRPVAIGAAAVGLGSALWLERHGAAAYPWRLSWHAFVAAVAVFALGPLLGAVAFWILVRDLTGTTALRASLRTWTRSFLARYVPSGALVIAVRVRERNRLRATTGQVWVATAVEQVVAALGGAVAATVALLLAGKSPPLVAPVIAFAAAAAVLALRPRTAARWLRRLPGVRSSPPLVSGRAAAIAAAVCCASWLATGTGAWLLISALTPSRPGFFFIVGAYALAWVVGFVIVFAPSGLGAREATLIALLAPSFGVPAATVLAIVLRFANTVSDLVVLLAVEAACGAPGLRPTASSA
jgi:glycosyltransferase 2 family protein